MNLINKLFSAKSKGPAQARMAPQAFGSDAYLQYALGNMTAEQAVQAAQDEQSFANSEETRQPKMAPKAFGSDAYLQFALGTMTEEQAVRVAYYDKAHSGLKMLSAEERDRVYQQGMKKMTVIKTYKY